MTTSAIWKKTDGKMLVSSYGCTAETADIEFAWMRRHTIDKGTHLGRHLIQAFGPGEVSAEVANESCYLNERKCPDREKTGRAFLVFMVENHNLVIK